MDSKRKDSGLSAFTRKRSDLVKPPQEEKMESKKKEDSERTRGKGDLVALTVRLPRSEWERLHQLAVAEGMSLQAILLEGISKVYAEKGLPRVKS
jgi:hypothetical protein